MKKIFYFLLLIAFLFTICGCKGTETNDFEKENIKGYWTLEVTGDMGPGDRAFYDNYYMVFYLNLTDDLIMESQLMTTVDKRINLDQNYFDHILKNKTLSLVNELGFDKDGKIIKSYNPELDGEIETLIKLGETKFSFGITLKGENRVFIFSKIDFSKVYESKVNKDNITGFWTIDVTGEMGKGDASFFDYSSLLVYLEMDENLVVKASKNISPLKKGEVIDQHYLDTVFTDYDDLKDSFIFNSSGGIIKMTDSSFVEEYKIIELYNNNRFSFEVILNNERRQFTYNKITYDLDKDAGITKETIDGIWTAQVGGVFGEGDAQFYNNNILIFYFELGENYKVKGNILGSIQKGNPLTMDYINSEFPNYKDVASGEFLEFSSTGRAFAWAEEMTLVPTILFKDGKFGLKYYKSRYEEIENEDGEMEQVEIVEQFIFVFSKTQLLD